MPEPIKILIVDDSVVIRTLLTKEFEKDPDLKVMGSAAHGKIALQRLEQERADIIILDLDMPIMNGVQTMKELGHEHPNIPVIIFSAQSKEDAKASLDAMQHGAQACIHKSSKLHHAEDMVDAVIHGQLMPLIKTLCGRASVQPSPVVSAALAAPAAPRRGTRKHVDPELLLIGASTGGPNAVYDVLSALPENFPLPVLIVQHMPAVFTQHFAERLNKNTNLTVSEAEEGMEVKPGHAYVAPGNYHMVLHGNPGGRLWLTLNQEPQEQSVRPAVDVTLRSAVDVMHDRLLTVILTGMGMDGLDGCRKSHAAGGTIIVQDQASSVVWGMPGFVAKEKLAHNILPLAQIGPQLALHCNHLKTGVSWGAAPAEKLPVPSSTHKNPLQPQATPTPDLNPKPQETPKLARPTGHASRTAATPGTDVPTQDPIEMQDSNDTTADAGQPVLLVDDSRAMRSMLKRMMTGLGLESVEAENGLDALEKIKTIGKPRFALVDWNMPEMNGLEFVKAIRSRPDMDGLALVMVTSETEMERVSEALEAGADEYMMKPFSTADLAEKLRELGLLAA